MNQDSSIRSYLNQFKTVSLNQIQSANLMDRIDTKFVFSIVKLNALLSSLIEYYNILQVNQKNIQEYKSLYFDTINRTFFLDHHNNRVNRFKVRFREYIGSDLVFLEVKCKNNKRKTLKKRMKVDSIPESMSKDQQDFINKIIGKKISLMSQQWVNFNRITLVDKFNTERLTIDLNLNFSNKFNSGSYEDIVIAEIKQDRLNRSSYFKRIAKDNHILPVRLSKYCMSNLYLNPSLKHNRFKEKLLLINKLKQLS